MLYLTERDIRKLEPITQPEKFIELLKKIVISCQLGKNCIVMKKSVEAAWKCFDRL